jgi:hypothetical protein
VYLLVGERDEQPIQRQGYRLHAAASRGHDAEA